MPMKICLINNLYKPYNRGGADKVVENTTNGLEKSGHDVFVISTKPILSRLAPNISNHNYYISSVFPYLNKIPKTLRLLWHFWDCFNLPNYFKIKEILKKEKPDIVITHNLKGLGYLTPKAIRSLKIKHIHYLHDIQLIHPSGLIFYGEEKKIESLFSKIYLSASKALFNSPNTVISPSKWLMSLHEKRNFFPSSRKIILKNPAIIKPSKKDLREIKEKIKFMYVGEIENHKGVFLAIKAFLNLNKKIKNIEFNIIGKGSKSEELKKISKKNKNIKILGWQNNEKVRKIMNKSDFLIMPSTCYENSPTVIYEAISERLNVIASKLGGNIELIEDFGGLLFEPDNINDLAEKMNYGIKNLGEIKKATLRGREKMKDINLENYIKKIEKIILQ